MRVVFLILDAFDPSRLSPRLTPNLWRWANEDGAVAGTGWSVMASSTYPNHASFVTGVGPDTHGFHTNHVIRHGEVRGAWEVGLDVPTLFSRLTHLETAAVLGDHHLVSVMGAGWATTHWPPNGDITLIDQLDPMGYPDDEAVMPPLVDAIDGPASLVFGYFGSIDTYSHIYGPGSDSATDAYVRIDRRIGDLDIVLRSAWEDTVLVVVSDHVQDAVRGPGIDLRRWDEDLVVVDEGSAALVGGLSDPRRLDIVDGIEGWERLADGNVLAWSAPGRYFGPFEEPILLGIHGGAHTRTQLAMVSGGARSRHPLSAEVAAGPVAATYWAGAIERILRDS
ncbi:MAG: alkaline phosphatase family protein [Acidimicrobiia bacterium]